MKKEDKRKTLMAMLFNKVNKNQIEKLINRKSATLAVENYVKIIEKYDENDVNEAKKALRAGLFKMMNERWIFHKALHATFRKGAKNVHQTRIVLEKYMIQFRSELKNNFIESFVNREKVMRIPSAIEREGF